MTKMFNVSINSSGVNEAEAKAWVEELGNVFADVEVDDVSVSNNKISFSAGLTGRDDTAPDDIRTKVDEYLTMNENFRHSRVDAGPIIIEPL